MTQRPERFDAAVIGGGLSGLAAASVLSGAGLHTLHVAPAGPPDRRTSALMMPSVDFLTASGLIDSPQSIGTPLRRIRIIDATPRLIRAPETLFDSAEAGLDAFAWNFPNTALSESFREAAAGNDRLVTVEASLKTLEPLEDGYLVRLDDGSAASVRLVVGADGKRSTVREAAAIGVREHKFQQSALVCDVELERGLEGTSVEFHYRKGPFTLVPAGNNRANLVWIDDHAQLETARASGPQGLTALLNTKSQHLFGAVSLASPSFVFPLATLAAHEAGRDGIALVGESLHAFPPLGAQGLNLGLRDVADLAASVAGVDTSAPSWAKAAVGEYSTRRRSDLVRTGTLVDTLYRSLLSDFLPAQALRAGGLWALKSMPGLRRQAFGVGMGRR